MSVRMILMALLMGPVALTAAEKPACCVTEAQALIARVLPAHASQFRCETIASADGKDVFEFDTQDGRVVLRGNNGVSLAMAFNQYLASLAKVRYDWLADGPLSIAGKLPLPTAKVRRTCAARERFFMNYCTYGYTMPWWRWERWERFIDWMAMNGINRPLAQAGLEAAWLRVWQSYGLKQQDIQAYFSGPAHLPWHRMGNLDAWGGPLPMSYIDGQMELQRKILCRARGLGMKPILSGFAGHVPEVLKTVKPEVKLSKVSWSGHFETFFIDPADPLFRDIQVRFIKEQAKLYGTDHLYAADPFNEMDPPSWEPAYLGGVAKGIYDGMAEADPEAVWYQMSWTFSFGNWRRPENIAALVNAVPKGRMVILDYNCEENELYRRNPKGFAGAPFIWCYLANFGGATHIVAPLKKTNARMGVALDEKGCLGIGSTLEGLNVNPVAYEFVLERPWLQDTPLDLEQWITQYAVSRCGSEDPFAIKAWTTLLNKVFLDRTSGIWGHGSLLQCIPHLRGSHYEALKIGLWPGPKVRYGQTDLLEALNQLMQADASCRRMDGYQFDLVNLTRQALGNYEQVLQHRMGVAYDTKDLPAFHKAARRLLELGADIETLLGTRREFLLGTWIADARSWGRTPEEKAYFERNSRQILTTWHEPGCTLTDYASRQWHGLFSSYCLPRWKEFIKRVEHSLVEGKEFDYKPFTEWRIDFETQWYDKSGEDFLTTPQGNPCDVARGIFEKYRAEVMEPAVLTLVSKKWEQDELPWSPIRWSYDASKDIQTPGTYTVTFKYTRGHAPFNILRVAAVQGEKEIAVDEHSSSVRGSRTGAYTLDLNQLEPGKPVELLIDVDFAVHSYALGSFSIEKKDANDK